MKWYFIQAFHNLDIYVNLDIHILGRNLDASSLGVKVFNVFFE